MTEAESVQLLGELVKMSGLQFHDIVIKESKRMRKPAEKAARTRGRKISVKTANYGQRSPAVKQDKKLAKPIKPPKPIKSMKQYKPSAKYADVQLIGSGGDLSKLATSSSVPRDISQVGTDQRPAPVEQALTKNPSAKSKRSAMGKPSLKVVL